MATAQTEERARLRRRLRSMDIVRQKYESRWKDVAKYQIPWRARFLDTDANEEPDFSAIVNNTATLAIRTSAAGMHAGITSPSRIWFILKTPDPELNKFKPAKSWLFTVGERMRSVFAGPGGFYNELSDGQYLDLTGFGTSALMVEQDLETVIRCESLLIGSYWLGTSNGRRIDTIFRSIPMTVEECVASFKLEACSRRVREQYRRGNNDQIVPVIQAVQPNAERDLHRADWRGMAFRSTWFEKNCDELDGLLRVSGYREFPALCPRWHISGHDPYGSASPGIMQTPDVKALQELEMRKLELVDKSGLPPMKGPEGLKRALVGLRPGDVTTVSGLAGAEKFEPAYTIHPAAIPATRDAARDHEDRIARTSYADVWLMFAMNDRAQPDTATEVAEKAGERFAQLGPLLESLNRDQNDPAISRTFEEMVRSGLVPEPPEELQGMELRIEYVSVAAEALKRLGIPSVERTIGFIGRMSALVGEEATDKINGYKTIDYYADMSGFQPDCLRSDEEAAARAAKRAEQKAAQSQLEAAQSAAGTAKTLADTSMEGDNALGRMVGQLAGVPTQGVPA